MSHRSTIKRLFLLFQIINRGGYPTRQALIAHLEEHLGEGAVGISSRTLDRSIQELRDEFDLFISYNKLKKGYEVDYEKSSNINVFSKFLELSITAGFANEAACAREHRLGENGITCSIEGSIWIKPLSYAIAEKRRVWVNYFSEESSYSAEYILQPLLLKELNGRWYLVANFADFEEKMRTLGLVRINDLKVLAEHFSICRTCSCYR